MTASAAVCESPTEPHPVNAASVNRTNLANIVLFKFTVLLFHVPQCLKRECKDIAHSKYSFVCRGVECAALPEGCGGSPGAIVELLDGSGLVGRHAICHRAL